MREGRIVLTMRTDMPLLDGAEGLRTWSAETLLLGKHAQSQCVHLLVYSHSPDQSPIPKDLISSLIQAACELGITVPSALWMFHERSFRFPCDRCDAVECIGHEMQQDHSAEDALRTNFAPPSQSRELIVEEIHGDEDPLLITVVERAEALRETAVDGRHDADIEALVELVNTPWHDEGSVGQRRREHLGQIAILLSDQICRDALIWLISDDRIEFSHAAQWLTEVTIKAPPAYRPGPATVLATMRWLQGDGVRAVAACERALDSDPDYLLARLLLTGLRAGLPPQMWREVVGSLSWEECRGKSYE